MAAAENQPITPIADETPFPSPDSGDPPASAEPQETTTVTEEQSNNVSTTSSSGGGRRRSVFMLGIALLLMVGGVIAGVYALSGSTFQRAVAWDCTLYKFDVSQSGAVTVENGSSRNLPAQLAAVYIDDQQVAEFDVSALDASEGESIGVVPVPEDGNFSWRVVGNKDCDQNGSFKPEFTAECINIKAFDDQWNPLSIEDLAEFDPGDIVRFSVAATTTTGSFQAARFTINDEAREPVTELRPGTNEYYDEYELPEDITSFSVGVELLHDEAGWF